MEALATGRRRQLARQTGQTSGRPYGSTYRWGERIREIADEIDAEEVFERRRHDMAKLAAPSDLIARAMAEWPNQAEAVQAYAKSAHIGLGEAWRRTIAAGVDALQESDGD
jgi:hypothetical protein